jgi:dCTP diphosphatase
MPIARRPIHEPGGSWVPIGWIAREVGASSLDARPPQQLGQSADTFVDMVKDVGTAAIKDLVVERDWQQFHSEENLAKSVAIEAGELLQCFQWGSDFDADRVQDELADVLTYCLLLADKLGVDPEQIVLQKLAVTREKYPVDKARGRSTKYDAL